MNLKNIIKKQTIIVVIAVITLAIASLATTYALFFQVNTNTTNQVVTAGTLAITYDNNNSTIIQNTGLLPMSDSDGLSSTGANVAIMNTGSLPASYVLNIENDVATFNSQVGSGSLVDFSNIKIAVFKVVNQVSEQVLEPTLLSSLNTESVNSNAKLLTDDRLLASEEVLYNVKIWIKDSAEDNISSQYVYLKLNVRSEIDNVLADSYILRTWQTNGIEVHRNPLPNTAFESVETTQVGVYPAEDDYGTSYYVRGASDYNYVKFGETSGGDPIWWNIIRINGDGTVRMIYRGIGDTVPAAGNTLDEQKFNDNYVDNMYVGYMYEENERQGLVESSNAKTQLETWYEDNLSANYGQYIADRIFCGDRTSTTNGSATWPFASNIGGTGTTATNYGAWARLLNGKTPILVCPEEPDKYTVESLAEKSSTGHGNGALTYPIGLITADEASYAGGVYSSSNVNTFYYLYSGGTYWAMSPVYFYSGGAFMWYIGAGGSIDGIAVSYQYGLRAVINLKNDLIITGTGTTIDPFRLATY